MLVAKLGGREATLDHRHQRLAVTLFEDELGLVLDARTVGPALGRVDDDATGPVDHSEEVFVVEDLSREGPNVTVQTPPTRRSQCDSTIQPGGGIDHSRESHVLAHRPAWFLST